MSYFEGLWLIWRFLRLISRRLSGLFGAFSVLFRNVSGLFGGFSVLFRDVSLAYLELSLSYFEDTVLFLIVRFLTVFVRC